MAVRAGQQVAQLGKLLASGKSVAFTPSGKLLATGSLDGTVWLWNAATGLDGTVRLWKLATGLDGTVRRWNPATGLDGTVRVWPK